MYDPSISAAQIEKAARKLGFTPEYHDVAQIQRNNAHFNDILERPDRRDSDGNLILYEDEKAWVRNERIVCMWDFCYWATRYAHILDFTDRLIPYSPNIAQQIIWDVDAEMEQDGRAIERANLKARRLGISTDAELKVAHRVQFHPNTNALIASSRPEKSAKMALIMERAWRNQPWFLLPTPVRPNKDWPYGAYNAGELIEFGAINSGVSIQHGAQFSGVARGDTPTIYHVSEVAEWVNAKSSLDASLLRAVLPTRWTFGVVEGTGLGKSGWWFETWLYSKANWKNGTARLMPNFLPWYVGRGLYPTSDEARQMPSNWKPEPETIQHANKAKEFVRKYDLLRKYLGSNWEMPPQQMWWWEKTKAEYKAKRELAIFYSELAADDLDAFNNPNPSVFDAELIIAYKNAVRRPEAVYALDGPSSLVDGKFKPNKRDLDPSLPVVNLGDDLVLKPLRFQIGTNEDPTGKIIVWEHPKENEEYGIGGDTSMGVGQDSTVFEGLRKGTMHSNDCQVFEFANPWINALQALPWCHALAKWYTVRVNGTLRQPLFCIETAAGGYLLQLELRKLRWARFHKWMRAYDSQVLDKSKTKLLGWATTGWSRDGLISKLLEYIGGGWININSPWFVGEMEDLESDEDRWKIAAAQGKHDDRIMALAMILFSLHDLEIRGTRPTIARQRVQSQEEAGKPALWTPPMAARSDLPRWAIPAWQPQMREDYEPEEEVVWPR